MQRLKGPYRVYVGLVSLGYLNREALVDTIAQGIKFCGADRVLEKLPPQSEVIVKPSAFYSNAQGSRYSYTHPEILHSALKRITDLAPSSTRTTVLAETSRDWAGFRILRHCTGNHESYRSRGYYEFEHQFPGRVSVLPYDEAELAEYQLAYGQSLSPIERNVFQSNPNEFATLAQRRAVNALFKPALYSKAQFVTFCPKLSNGIFTQGFSGALQLMNPHRDQGLVSDFITADALEVCQPDLIVSDGVITAIGGNRFTSRGHELGVILVANNALAHDWVAAQILSINPASVHHIQIAMQRGWGPESGQFIELGGAGKEAIGLLAQKSNYWDMGLVPLESFQKKFEDENPGLSFPFEIMDAESESSQAVLSWIYRTYDIREWRARIAQWPRATLCVGPVRTYPKEYLVFAFGPHAINSLELLISHSRKVISYKGVVLSRVQLKNGERHIVIKCASSSDDALTRAFGLGSLGKMTIHLTQMHNWLDRTVFKWVSRWRQSRNQLSYQTSALSIVKTSKLRHNHWWSLAPLIDQASTRAKQNQSKSQSEHGVSSTRPERSLI